MDLGLFFGSVELEVLGPQSEFTWKVTSQMKQSICWMLRYVQSITDIFLFLKWLSHDHDQYCQKPIRVETCNGPLCAGKQASEYSIC